MTRTASPRMTVFLAVALLAACGGATPAATSTEPTPTRAAASTTPASTSPASTAAPPSRPALALLPQLPTSDLDAATAGRLDAALDDLVAQGYPDVLAAVITTDGAWAGAAGVDGRNGRVATPTDQFNIASVSKSILAALVLKLDQDGVMDLDAPLSSYLGGFDVDANGATVRDALAMRSGIGDTPGEALDEAKQDCTRAWSRAEALATTPAPSGPAGKAMVYSNPTYKLVGAAAETASGKSLDDAYAEVLFAPLGLDGIRLQTADSSAPKPWALPIAGHEGTLGLDAFGTGGSLPCRSLTTFSFQNAVAADAPSLARWAWALFEGRIIDEAHLLEMTSTSSGSWALGIERLSGFGQEAWGTAGHQDGYNAFFAVVPESKVVVVVFINDGNADAEAASHRLVGAIDG